MTPPAFASAAAFSATAVRPSESTRRDIALLQSHVQRCGQESGRWGDIRTSASAVHHFFASRFATTLTLMLVVIVAVSMSV